MVLGRQQPCLELSQPVAQDRVLDRQLTADLYACRKEQQPVKRPPDEVGIPDERALVLEGRAVDDPALATLADDEASRAETVGQLYELICAKKSHTPGEIGRLYEDELWVNLQALIAGQCGLERIDIRYNARFVDDLNLD